MRVNRPANRQPDCVSAPFMKTDNSKQTHHKQMSIGPFEGQDEMNGLAPKVNETNNKPDSGEEPFRDDEISWR